MPTPPTPPRLGLSPRTIHLEDLAFACEQLAGMLRTGIPLEGGLKEVARGMKDVRTRKLWLDLEQDLAAGKNLHESLVERGFPTLLTTMVRAGQSAHELPRMLILLADHYHQMNELQMRFKGLMAYPLIVLVGTMTVSFVVVALVTHFITLLQVDGFASGMGLWMQVQLWTPPILMLLIIAALFFGLRWEKTRHRLRSWIPGFKEASLSQMASFLHVLLHRGVPLPESLRLARETEPDPRMQREIALWESRIALGGTPFPDPAEHGSLVPPLFKWMVSSSQGDWVDGFARTAEIYRARARHRMELALYASVPVTILLLGALMVLQFIPIARHMAKLTYSIGGF